MKLRCNFAEHERVGCKCIKCNFPMHDFQEISRSVKDADCCCWSSSDPCVGPNCGYPCDNWYNGRAGSVVVVLCKCRRCGLEESWEENKADRDFIQGRF